MDASRYAEFLERMLASLRADHRVLGLVALGSTAGASHAPDRWSDHDVWVVARPGEAEWFRTHTGWLPDPERVVLVFRETAHGIGVLYDDGHLVEAAAFEPDELVVTRANDYAVLLDRERIAERLEVVRHTTIAAAQTDPHALAGRFLTSLLVGVGRHRRGELLSGREAVAGVAVWHLLRLAGALGPPAAGEVDDLDPRRRVERAYPELAARVEAALALPTEPAAVRLLEAGVDLAYRAGIAPGAVTAVAVAIGADPPNR